METSGLILDVYDDLKGDVLRSLYPTPERLPDFVKSAMSLSAEDRNRLPDDAFALVLQTPEGRTLRKFACIDEGNTALSVQYFLANVHKLPEAVQKTAAANLVTACGWYDLGVPAPLAKIADVTGTGDMPYQEPTDKATGGEKAVIKKATSMPHLVPGHKGESGNFGPEETEKYDGYTPGKSMKAMPQMKQMKPHVYVEKKASVVEQVMKESEHYALPSEKKYPLDTYVQIKTAGLYFDEFYKDFKPAHRHEYAANLLKRANAVGLTMSDMALRYGAQTYASIDDIKVAFEVRDKAAAWDDNARDMLHELFEKRAGLDPEIFARALGEWDKTAGITHLYDAHVPDPFLSTFGSFDTFEKTANAQDVNEQLLQKLARSSHPDLEEKFASDFRDEFRRDPVGIFQSMPTDQQKILLKMAHEAA